MFIDLQIINIRTSQQDIDTSNPMYINEEGFEPVREREIETILSLANGYIGTRNSLPEYYRLSTPATFVAGIYEKSADFDYNELVKLPNWTRIEIFVEDGLLNLFDTKTISHRRYMDLYNGRYVREWINQDKSGRTTNVKIIEFVSLAKKHEVVKILAITPVNYTGKIKVRSGMDAMSTTPIFTVSKIASTIPEYVQAAKFVTLSLKPKDSNRQIAMSQKSEFWINNKSIPLIPYYQASEVYYNQVYEEDKIYEEFEWIADIHNTYIINSLVSIYTTIDGKNPVELSKAHLTKLDGYIYDNCLKPHTYTWTKRWAESHVTVDYDLVAQRWINFALYHLIIAGEFSGNFSSIPARTLSGEAYKGHIFWDTEIFMLPFFIFTKPEIAKALLLYRYNTLPGAIENAKKEGYRGACYAWESTDSGLEMAPPFAFLPDGQVVRIYSGKYENHITPDIAYAAWQYWTVTHDEEFLLNHGAEMIFETARFCRSLMIEGSDGFYHINNVVGPDEYHSLVDDNVYMNLMVQFNLETALKIVDLLKNNYKKQYETTCKKINLKEKEIEDWSKTNDRIYVSCNPETGIYEQFKGYFDLKYVDLKKYEPRTAPMDIILGRDKIETTQIIKQADVVMIMFLLANRFHKDIISKNYDYYEPRTGHGSSLSPGIYSLMAARLNKMDLAYKYFKQVATIDLDNNMGNAAGGAHAAALGAVWMSMVMGFGGMYIQDKGLVFDPHLPEQWDCIEFSVKWRNQRIKIKITKTEMIFNNTGTENIFLSAGFDNWKNITPNIEYAATFDQKWKWK